MKYSVLIVVVLTAFAYWMDPRLDSAEPVTETADAFENSVTIGSSDPAALPNNSMKQLVQHTHDHETDDGSDPIAAVVGAGSTDLPALTSENLFSATTIGDDGRYEVVVPTLKLDSQCHSSRKEEIRAVLNALVGGIGDFVPNSERIKISDWNIYFSIRSPKGTRYYQLSANFADQLHPAMFYLNLKAYDTPDASTGFKETKYEGTFTQDEIGERVDAVLRKYLARHDPSSGIHVTLGQRTMYVNDPDLDAPGRENLPKIDMMDGNVVGLQYGEADCSLGDDDLFCHCRR